MDNVTLTLPSGYIVTFKPYLRHGDRRALTRMMTEKMTVDPNTGESDTTLTGATIMEGQDLALKLMIVSIQLPDGSSVSGDVAFNLVQDMRDEDGKAVYDKMDELTKGTTASEDDKKKLNLTSSDSSNQVGQ